MAHSRKPSMCSILVPPSDTKVRYTTKPYACFKTSNLSGVVLATGAVKHLSRSTLAESCNAGKATLDLTAGAYSSGWLAGRYRAITYRKAINLCVAYRPNPAGTS